MVQQLRHKLNAQVTSHALNYL